MRKCLALVTLPELFYSPSAVNERNGGPPIIKVKLVSKLEPGEKFIWADDYTRDFMCADENPEVLQVLTAVKHEDTDTCYDDERIIRFTQLNGHPDYLYYNKNCRVIVIDRANDLFAYGVKCDNCGVRYGSHYCNGDARKSGIRCQSGLSEEWFVPNQKSLWDFHREVMSPAYKTGEDFFSSIGLWVVRVKINESGG